MDAHELSRVGVYCERCNPRIDNQLYVTVNTMWRGEQSLRNKFQIACHKTLTRIQYSSYKRI